MLVESAPAHGAFRRAALRDNQVRDPRSLLALHVNGADLSPDHGYPARIIVPAAPGVHNTKWVARLTFGDLWMGGPVRACAEMPLRPLVGSPLQLLLLACSFALAGYAGVRLLAGDWFGVALWFVGAALLHDLVLLPLYAVADRGRSCRAVGTRRAPGVGRVRPGAGRAVRAAPAGVVPADQRPGGGPLRSATGLSGGRLPRPLAADHGRAVRRLGAAVPVLRLRRATKQRPPAVH